MDKVFGEFHREGRVLLELGLVGSHSGNMSLRQGKTLSITRHGAMLGFLKSRDIVTTGMSRGAPGSVRASREVDVHRAILNALEKNGVRAVVHAHPECAIALSLLADEIIPVDVEGSYYLPRVPVIEVSEASGSREMEEALPPALRTSGAVVVRGHGSFAAGSTLEEALLYTSVLEAGAAIIVRVKSLGGDPAALSGRSYLRWPNRAPHGPQNRLPCS